MDKVKLTSLVESAGCAAKLKAKDLLNILKDLKSFSCSSLECGFDNAEDAAVYNIDDNISLISTVDFFPPMVDDPYIFGQIAAANAISDIYAMGAKPLYALSLVCFSKKLDLDILKEILRGGIDKASEAEIPICGGHSIDDSAIKYGLSVTGIANRGKVWRNNTIENGDSIVFTKKLGVGIINTAVKCDEVSKSAIDEAIESMLTLNKKASENAKKFKINACTDVTGFGLLGHLSEMASLKKYTVEIDSKSVPYIKEAYDLAEYGILPCGLYYNMEYTAGKLKFADSVPQPLRDIMYDPETSGGLLLSMPKKDAEEYVKIQEGSKIIGFVGNREDFDIVVN